MNEFPEVSTRCGKNASKLPRNFTRRKNRRTMNLNASMT